MSVSVKYYQSFYSLKSIFIFLFSGGTEDLYIIAVVKVIGQNYPIKLTVGIIQNLLFIIKLLYLIKYSIPWSVYMVRFGSK